MPKPSDADQQRFRDLAPDDPTIEVKPMFGNLGAFVNGNVFMGLFGPSIGLKLADADRDDLLAIDGAGPFGPSDRPMGGYVALPPSFTDHEASAWIGRAVAHVSELPPKVKKPKQQSR